MFQGHTTTLLLTNTIAAALLCMTAGAANAASTPKIIGGTPAASASEFPWQVALFSDKSDVYQSQYCGGTLISERWVVTAAHCAESSDVTFVAAGIIDLDNALAGEVAKVQTWYVHPQFNDVTFDNDIALLKLEQPLDFDRCGANCLAIQPVTPDNEAFVMPNSTPAIITGWGNRAINDGNDFPLILESAAVIITDCLAAGGYQPAEITNNMVCAGVADFSKDTCQGDSGGPLVVEDNDGLGTPLLAGITSWGEDCAVANYPGVYTRVANFKAWIDATIEANCCTPDVVLVDEIHRSKKGKSKFLGEMEWWVVLGAVGVWLRRRHFREACGQR